MRSRMERHGLRRDFGLALGLFFLTLLAWKVIVDQYAGTGIAVFAGMAATLSAGLGLGVWAHQRPVRTALSAQGLLALPMTLLNVRLFLWPYAAKQLIDRGVTASPDAVLLEIVQNPHGDVYGLAFRYFLAWDVIWLLAGCLGAGLGGRWRRARAEAPLL